MPRTVPLRATSLLAMVSATNARVLSGAAAIALLCVEAFAAQNLVRNPGFEEGNANWEARAAYGTRAIFEKSQDARGGERVAHLVTYIEQIGGRFGTIVQKTETLAAGVYELTAWVKGAGKLRLVDDALRAAGRDRGGPSEYTASRRSESTLVASVLTIAFEGSSDVRMQPESRRHHILADQLLDQSTQTPYSGAYAIARLTHPSQETNP